MSRVRSGHSTLLDSDTLRPDCTPNEIASIVTCDQGFFDIEWRPFDADDQTGRRSRFQWEHRVKK